MRETVTATEIWHYLHWAPKKTPGRRFPRDITARRREIVMRDAHRHYTQRRSRAIVELHRQMAGGLERLREPVWTKQ